jgi:NADH-quinone oxidoreductase subunit J
MDYDLIAKLMFGLYALIILAGGIIAVASGSLVRALVGLVLTFFGVAGMYLLMAAPFMALMQLLIYVGAVVVIMFFAVMLTGGAEKGGSESSRESGEESTGKLLGAKLRRLVPALVGALVPAGILAWVCITYPPASERVPEEVDVGVLGEALLGDYVLAFELISVVLFVAMAGAVLLGFERRRAGRATPEESGEESGDASGEGSSHG